MANDETPPAPAAPTPSLSPSAPEPTQSIDAPPSASTSQSDDSAPPPSQPAPLVTTDTPALPPIEPRDYNNPTPSSLSSIRPVTLPPAYAPNSTVPNFIRTLAILVFVVGGTSATAIAWVYKNILYPRLVLALKARTVLHQDHLKGYTKFVDDVRSFGLSGTRTLIGGLKDRQGANKVDSKEDPLKEETQSDKEEKVPSTEGGDETQPLFSGSDESSTLVPTTIPIEAPTILSPLLTSLQTLSSTLHTSNLPPNSFASTHSSAPFTTPNPNATHQFTPPRSAAAASAAAAAQSRLSPDHTLVSSLGSLNEWVENQVYAIATQGYRTYGSVSGVSSTSGNGGVGGTSGGKEFKALGEATAGFKSEIRAVKGLLLNRRNFAVGTAGR